MTALSALAAAAFSPPSEGAIPAGLDDALRVACRGAWRAVEVVLAGDVLRNRLGKTRDSIVRDAVEGVLGLFAHPGLRPEALAALRAARDAGELDGDLDLQPIVATVRRDGAVTAGRNAIGLIRQSLTDYRDLETALADLELGTLLIDASRALFRATATDPSLAPWAIGPTGSPRRDHALAAFAELVGSPASLDELESLIALPIALDDNVQFTVYRPRSIDPGTWHQLLAFAHLAERRPDDDDLADPVEEVKRQAAQVLGDKARGYQPMTQDAGAAIPAEGELTFVPELPGLDINPPRRSFLWLETVHREEFRIRAPRALDGKTVRGRLTVFLGSIAIAEVGVSVRVDAARPEPRREPSVARTYRKIFASYSHRDIAIVNQFESYARALGDEYLRDWVHLRTGEVWNDRLRQLIEQADAFQLFWSWNSMHSKFVRQEYEHALALNRPSFVRPTYWEEPMPTAPGLPPEALLRLHFQKLGGSVRATAEQLEEAEQMRAERKRAVAKPSPAAVAVDREVGDVTDVDVDARAAAATRQDMDAFEEAPADAAGIDSLGDTGQWRDRSKAKKEAEPARPAPPPAGAPMPAARMPQQPMPPSFVTAPPSAPRPSEAPAPPASVRPAPAPAPASSPAASRSRAPAGMPGTPKRAPAASPPPSDPSFSWPNEPITEPPPISWSDEVIAGPAEAREEASAASVAGAPTPAPSPAVPDAVFDPKARDALARKSVGKIPTTLPGTPAPPKLSASAPSISPPPSGRPDARLASPGPGPGPGLAPGPGPIGMAPTQAMHPVSPYAPTVPHESYKGDIPMMSAPPNKAKLPTAPPSSARLILGIVVILVLLAAIVTVLLVT